MKKGLILTVVAALLAVGFLVVSGIINAQSGAPSWPTAPAQTPAQPQQTVPLQPQIPTVQQQIGDLQQKVSGLESRLTITEGAVANNEELIAGVASAAQEAADDAKMEQMRIEDAARRGIVENAELIQSVASAAQAGIETNAERIHEHEKRIVNAQKSANRALAGIYLAAGHTKNEAKKLVKSYVTGSLGLEKLVPTARKISGGVQTAQSTADGAQAAADDSRIAADRAQATADDAGIAADEAGVAADGAQATADRGLSKAQNGLELMHKHGSKEFLTHDHDKNLAKGARHALGH